VESLSVLEIGCGMGGNLAELIKLGFVPENLTGIDLLEARIISARRKLPSGVTLIHGDALTEALPDTDYDVVYASTVFSSILDVGFQEILARRMWSLVKPGGIVLWYDFIFDNPNNADVRGVPVRRIRAIFPEGSLRLKRVTLAPPISRRVTRLHPALYPVFNIFPFLRTHVLCEIKKKAVV
jgi:SAM-dependent methyltransferase